MAIRIRTISNLSKLSPVQIVSVIVIAIIYVCFRAFLDKKKPEWKGIKNKTISLVVMIPLLILAVFIFTR